MKTDSEIQKEVIVEFQWEPVLNPGEIGIAVKAGVVTLTGTVNSYRKKIAAENATWRVKGVKAVAGELVVNLGNEGTLTDAEIAENIVNTLKWHTAIPDEKIEVKVTDGWVYLEGEVTWNFQKDSAFNAVRYLKGVKGVTSLMTAKQRINTTVDKENIRKLLERNADFETSNIQVETPGNKVELKGSNCPWVEKNAAERAAWSAHGVAAAENLLVIDYD